MSDNQSQDQAEVPKRDNAVLHKARIHAAMKLLLEYLDVNGYRAHVRNLPENVQKTNQTSLDAPSELSASDD